MKKSESFFKKAFFPFMMLMIGVVTGIVVKSMMTAVEPVGSECPTPKETPAKITTERDAQTLVTNYTGYEKLFYLSDEQFNQLAWMRNATSTTGNGFLLYFGAESSSTDYNRAVITRTELSSDGKLYDLKTYYSIGRTSTLGAINLGTCPKMCDIESGLTVDLSVATEPERETVPEDESSEPE